MARNQFSYRENLLNKPLGEAIFELRWALVPGQQELQHDPGLQILIGRFYDGLKESYPFIEDLPASQVPQDMTPYIVRHRFRPSENTWPLVQLGPGIMTVNETESYTTWKQFESRIQTAINTLLDAYPSNLNKLTFLGIQLTYINAIVFDSLQDSMINFLREKLHISISIEPELFENQKLADYPFELNLLTSFALMSPKGTGILRFSNGTKNEEPVIVWQIAVRSLNDEVPQEKEKLRVWLDEAHKVVEKWFFTLIRGELQDTFEAQHGHSNH